MRLIYAVLLALLLFQGCNRNDTGRVKAAPEGGTATTDRMKQQRDDYVSSVDAKLAEFDKKFDGLDARAKAMTGAVKTNFTSSIARLRDQRKVVSRKLDDLKKVSLDSWMSLKGEVDAAIANLDRSYEQVSAANETLPAAGHAEPGRH